jgi:DNA-binding response OmpR family regulator
VPSGNDEKPETQGQEVLVVDKDTAIAAGMPAALGRLGMVVTVTADVMRARDLCVNKFFTAALLDVDTPTPGAGIELLRFVREKSPLTSVVVMTARKAFDIAVLGFRNGAADVIVKEPDSLAYLKKRMVAIAEELQATSEKTTLLEDVAEIHQDFLRQMRDLSRQRLNLEDRLLGRESSQAGSPHHTCSVLLVDDDEDAAVRFAVALPQSKGWTVSHARSGGEALDLVTRARPHIALVKEQLPDLPGRIVIGSVKAAAPDAVALLYDSPFVEGRAGFLRMIDGSRVMDLMGDLETPSQLAAPLDEVREGIQQKLKERRYLQAFRHESLDFLQRYNQIRQRIQRILDRGKTTA